MWPRQEETERTDHVWSPLRFLILLVGIGNLGAFERWPRPIVSSCAQTHTNTHTHGQGQWSTGGQHSWTAVVQLCEWWRCWAAINVTCWRMMTEPTLECWTTLTPLCSSLFYSICMISFICLGLSLTQIMLVQDLRSEYTEKHPKYFKVICSIH